MKSPFLVDEYTCGICGVKTRVFSNRPDKYVRGERCKCCGLPLITEKSETWKDKLYKAFLKNRRY